MLQSSKKLGLRRLGLVPVARGRSRGVHRDICRRQGALTIPRRLCDRKSLDPPILVASFDRSFPLLNYWRILALWAWSVYAILNY